MSDLYEWVKQMNQILVQKDGEVSFNWWARLKEKFALLTPEVVVVVWGGSLCCSGNFAPTKWTKQKCLFTCQKILVSGNVLEDFCMKNRNIKATIREQAKQSIHLKAVKGMETNTGGRCVKKN